MPTLSISYVQTIIDSIAHACSAMVILSFATLYEQVAVTRARASDFDTYDDDATCAQRATTIP